MKLLLSMLVALWSASCCAAPNIALYYGADPPWDELRAFDVAVVEPDHGFDPQRLATSSTEIFA
jgi:polysaccharide biosynthesis protein PelA